ncbi:MAG: ABC transporter ATP-binding protein [Prevotella sp.]
MEKTDIRLEHLTIGYNGRRKDMRIVARDLDRQVEGGRIICLIGRNGTGKSTLLRTIAGFQPPLEGRIIIGGCDISTASARRMARLVGVVLTTRPDIHNTTVEALVALGRAPYTGFWGSLSEADREIVDRSLRLTGITDIARRNIRSLSDGQMQRVMVAKTLAQQTPVILLDEPTAFLDYPGKNAMMGLLASLAHDEGKTILLSTHDLDAALVHADRIWMMQEDGITDGTPVELCGNGVIGRYKKS